MAGSTGLLLKCVVALLVTLLCANTVLFYKMWFIETKLFDGQSRMQTPEDVLRVTVRAAAAAASEDASDSTSRQSTEWLTVLQRQELQHQMELERWYEILGTATELLRKVAPFTLT